eukprot:508034-Karenia_brevis.AAC.1
MYFQVDGFPSHFKERDVVEALCSWKSEAYPNGWEVIPSSKPYITRSESKWRVAAARPPPTKCCKNRSWSYSHLYD